VCPGAAEARRGPPGSRWGRFVFGVSVWSREGTGLEPQRVSAAVRKFRSCEAPEPCSWSSLGLIPTYAGENPAPASVSAGSSPGWVLQAQPRDSFRTTTFLQPASPGPAQLPCAPERAAGWPGSEVRLHRPGWQPGAGHLPGCG